MKLEFIPIPDVPEIVPGDPVGAILARSFRIEAADIVVVAQKVVSKAEGRIIHLADVTPSAKALALGSQMDKDPRLVETILRETRRIVRCRGDVLICETHHGFICANAGVDRSNVDGGESVTLLPRDPDRSANRIAQELGCAVIVTDTFGRAWREGLVDVAIGVSRLPPLLDLRGTRDTAGYSLHATVLAAADSIAAAAGLVMGKTQRTPAVIVRGFPYTPGASSVQPLLRPKEKDLFM